MADEDELTQLRATVRELKDRYDIHALILREARGRDRQDEALTASCYWPDGHDEHGPAITPAPDYPARANWGHALFFQATSHSITNHLCEIDGDEAWAESYVVGALLDKDGARCKIAPGRYIDHLQRRDGEWRIKARRTIVDMALEGDASWLASPAVSGFLRGSWGREDPSWQRPVEIGADGPRW